MGSYHRGGTFTKEYTKIYNTLNLISLILKLHILVHLVGTFFGRFASWK